MRNVWFCVVWRVIGLDWVWVLGCFFLFGGEGVV